MVPYIDIKNISKSYGDLELYSDLSFTISQGDKCALIAKNGAGKSTLLNIIAGAESAESGSIIVRNGITIGFLEQEPKFVSGVSVLDAVYHTSSELTNAIKDYSVALLSDDIDRINRSMEEMDRLSAWGFEEQAKIIFTKLKINNLSQNIDTLSGGERKRVALAMLLINNADVFILDEPTNHIDLDMAEWLEDYLFASKKTILMVTHDRYFLDRVCNTIYEIDQKNIYSYKGNYSDYIQAREDRIEQFNSEITKAKNIYRRELEWMRRMPQARGTKAKYRKDAFYETKDKAFATRDDTSVQINIKSERMGTKIFEAKDISFRYDDKVILDKFNYTFNRYEKMGIVGRNGAGKSTFLNILTQQTMPQGGVIEVGTTIRFGYYKQNNIEFDKTKKVIDIATDIAEVITLGNGKTITASQFLNMFLFTPESQYNLVSKLSGGERRRLYLLTILMQNPNFLILDEPTNDLDIMTLNVLEEYLENFSGCLMVVSHDRYFMDKVVDKLMIFEGDGAIRHFAGNYTEYRNKLDEEEQQSVKQVKTVTTERVTNRERKLTFKERKELESLSESIEKLESEKTEIETVMSSGTISSDKINELSERHFKVRGLLDEQELRWLELSDI